MTYQERAAELIEKFDAIYPDSDWTSIASKSIDDLISLSTDSGYIEYWGNIKDIVLNREKKS